MFTESDDCIFSYSQKTQKRYKHISPFYTNETFFDNSIVHLQFAVNANNTTHKSINRDGGYCKVMTDSRVQLGMKKTLKNVASNFLVLAYRPTRLLQVTTVSRMRLARKNLGKYRQ